ncbi:MAG: Exonuclease large subunit [Crocinitomicaceae bacterium]|jgi:exodeoxyribonuclease VII large subunit|nr:Exonuclease large subunit [Crocinitomicaceae bacterium]
MSEKQVFTLRQVAQSIQRVISERYQQSYWVQAEMFKLNYTAKGHCFPELVHKEEGKVLTEMRGTIWNAAFQRISKSFAEVVKEPLRDGMNLLMLVRITFHPVYGLSLEIIDIDPTYSLGELQKEREETLKKLKAEGIINNNQLLDFPLLPKRLAIISMESSKGFQDFRTLISHNQQGYKFVYRLFPSQLNGDAAIPSIIGQLKEIEKLRQHFDVVLIVRGGGGEIGLSCYNNYELSKAIATFPLPVLTGIGHSTNVTVSEMVAYRNAITPSDLADLLLRVFRDFDVSIQDLARELRNSSVQQLQEQKTALKQESRSFKFVSEALLQQNQHELKSLRISLLQESKWLFQQANNELGQIRQRLQSQTKFASRAQLQRIAYLRDNLRKSVRAHMQDSYQLVEDSKFYLLQEVPKYIARQEDELKYIRRNLDLVDPQNVLKRGYSIVLNSDKRLLSQNQPAVGDALEIINFDSVIEGKITQIKKSHG